MGSSLPGFTSRNNYTCERSLKTRHPRFKTGAWRGQPKAADDFEGEHEETPQGQAPPPPPPRRREIPAWQGTPGAWNLEAGHKHNRERSCKTFGSRTSSGRPPRRPPEESSGPKLVGKTLSREKCRLVHNNQLPRTSNLGAQVSMSRCKDSKDLTPCSSTNPWMFNAPSRLQPWLKQRTPTTIVVVTYATAWVRVLFL